MSKFSSWWTSDDSWRRMAAKGGVAVVLLWLATPLLVFGASLIFKDADTSSMGVIGDLYGAGTSLFSALGTLGLLIVLAFEMQERRRDLSDRGTDATRKDREIRPLVLPQPSTQASRLNRATWAEGDTSCTLGLTLEFVNVSAYAALNVEASFELSGESGLYVAKSTALVLPLAPDRPTDHSVSLKADEEDARGILSDLSVGKQLKLKVSVDHQALNGLGWNSSVDYSIKCADPDDHERIRQILNRVEEEYIDPSVTGSKPVVLVALPVAGTWQHSEK